MNTLYFKGVYHAITGAVLAIVDCTHNAISPDTWKRMLDLYEGTAEPSFRRGRIHYMKLEWINNEWQITEG